MQRFFIKNKQDNIFIANKDISFQMSKVLRYQVGQEVEVVFQEKPYLCKINSINNKEVRLSIIEEIKETRELSIKINLYMSLIKKDKFELALQKASELGVVNIIPVITSRSIIQLEKKNIEKKIERWSKIVQEAAEQCRRTIAPKIAKPITIDQIAKQDNLSLVCFEEENSSNNIKTYLQNTKDKIINVFIGPEGGITLDEIGLLKERGFSSISLGKRILRAETAAISVISTIIYEKALGE